MTDQTAEHDEIRSLAEGDLPVLETLAQMTINTFERSGLDLQTYMVARLAALVALDAAPASYLLNLGAANEFGIPMDVVRGTLVAVAPVVGAARIVSASGNMLRALGLAEAVAESDA